MHRTTMFRYALSAVVALGLAACSESPTPPSMDPALVRASAQGSPQGVGMPSDNELDRQIPGFGGFFFDRDGAPTIYLARGAGRGPAEQALARALSARGLSVASLRVREAQYRWQQLQRWQDDATVGAFDVAGTVFVDNDETTNRIKIGVENTATAGQVRAAVARLGVPDDAVIVQQTQPIVQVASLRDRIRPIPAGVQINFPGFLCSVGFNVNRGTTQSPIYGFVTASHCTNTQGGTENTPYWQPLQSVDQNQIATEHLDPVYTRGGKDCPKGRSCRYSDASQADYTSPNDLALAGFGTIAVTNGVNNGNIDFASTIKINGDECPAVTGGCLRIGDVVDKVGRTTGRTSGSITNTCTNTGVQGSRIVQLCQTFVAAGVGGGDSGSDVFVVNGGGAILAGVLWGGSSSGDSFVYSPLGNVFRELGTMLTH